MFISLGRFLLLQLMISALVICGSGCGSGGSGSSGSGTSSLSGSVVDGYVAGAMVRVYSSSELSPENRIGSGRTDAQGRFNLTLNVGRIPYPLYIKTSGGTDIETGLPAPSLLFVGEDQGGEVVVTPLTDMHYKLALMHGLVGAEDGLVERLNALLVDNVQDMNTIFGDPEQDGLLKDALDKVLASGTQTSTLSEGNYTVVIAHIDNTQVNNATFTCHGLTDFLTNNVAQGSLTVDGQRLSGRISGQNATGHIQGGSFILDINATGDLTRLAGTVGLMGSAAGTYINIPPEPSTLSDIDRGAFAASFIQEEGLVVNTVKELARRLYSGKRNLLFRDTLGQDYDIGVASDLTISDIDPSTLAVSASGFEVYLAPDDVNATSISFTNGTLISTNSSLPSSLIALEFAEPGLSSRDFFIQPIGLRQGFYLVSKGTNGEVYAAGQAFLSSANSTTPHLEPFKDYSGRIMAVSLNATGQNRDDVLWKYHGTGFSTTPPDNPLQGFAMKTIDGEIFGSAEATLLFNGGMLGLYHHDGMDTLDTGSGLYAQRAIMEIFETGAVQGTGIFGNSNPDLINFPCPYVGFALKNEAFQAPSYNGRLDFLYRILYVSDSEISEIRDISYVYGTLNITGSSAVLSYTDSQGETGQATLAVDDRETGLYHIHGPIGPSGQAQYTDIFWPVGGTKGAVLVSSGSGTNDPIVEVGEAFMTF